MDYLKLYRLENLSSYEKLSISDTSLKINLEFYRCGVIVFCHYTQLAQSTAILSLVKIRETLSKNFRLKNGIVTTFTALESPANTELQINSDGTMYIKRTIGTYAFGIVSYLSSI